ncbi:MAG: lytic murein transglycosylase [Patescibacteria group bacterium]|nr:lytic murein transglycosylase [Patescibacteria group bacterium]MDE1945956.1 lytic murein transglycosylase [Patescibacteria group bacterium]
MFQKFSTAFIILMVLLLVGRAHAQTAPSCLSFPNQLNQSQKAECQNELAQVQAELSQAEAAAAAQHATTTSIQKQVSAIAAAIKVEQLDIQAKNLLIKTLGDNITDTQNQIDSLDAQIESNKQDLAGMLREVNQADHTSLLEILLSNETISGFLSDAANLELLSHDLNSLSQELAVEEASSTAAKGVLVNKQNDAEDARYEIQQAQKALQANQATQGKLLAVSQASEKAKQAYVSATQKQIDAINAKLFALAGGSNAIPFGVAYQYALSAQRATGVDPAFLLAIMTQETNLGNNQGTCYLSNPSTGAGVNVRTGAYLAKVMSPTRDVPPFLTITNDLSVDPYHTIVSCPQSYGWGGAMGPAQFIASTWMGLVSRVANALGISGMPNPWNPEHAFMASAIYLADLGASGGGYTADMRAACRYYGTGGSSCTYGRSVLAIASNTIQPEINTVNGL